MHYTDINEFFKRKINKLIIIDVGGDIMNDLNTFDIFSMGRDALNLLVFLYIKDNYLEDLEIEINVYGVGVDGSDYPNNIIKTLEKFNFEENYESQRVIKNTIDNYFDTFHELKLLSDKRATGVLYNSIIGSLTSVVLGLKNRRK